MRFVRCLLLLLGAFALPALAQQCPQGFTLTGGVCVSNSSGGGLGPVILTGTPTAGEVPTATSGTAATWQPLSGTGCTTSGTAILKGDGSGGCANGTADTNYAAPPGQVNLTSSASMAYGSAAGVNQFNVTLSASITSPVCPTAATVAKVTYVFHIVQAASGGPFTNAWPSCFQNFPAIGVPVEAGAALDVGARFDGTFFWSQWSTNTTPHGIVTLGSAPAAAPLANTTGYPFYSLADQDFEMEIFGGGLMKGFLAGVDVNPVTGQLTISPTTCTSQLLSAISARGAGTCSSITPAELPVATTSALGAVQPDGSTITIVAGVISAAAASGTSTLTIANAGSTGTTIHTLTKLTGAPSTAVIAATTDTGGIVGVTTSASATTGNATIQINGAATCVFAGATTAGHYVGISSATAGNCVDAGATYPTSGQVVGRVLSTNASAGTYSIDIFPSEIQAQAGGSGITNLATGAGLTGGPITTTGTIATASPVNAQTGTSYTVLSTDQAKLVTFANAGAVAVTLPVGSTSGFGAGWYSDLTCYGPGIVTITPTTSTINNGASAYACMPGSGVRIFIDASNNYQIQAGTLFPIISGGSGQANTTGATRYYAISSSGNGGVEAGVYSFAPQTGTLRNLTFMMGTAQPASGSLTVNLRKAPSPYTTPANCGLQIVIAASAAAGLYQDLTHTCSVLQGDILDYQIVNAATANSGSIVGMSMYLQ
jgi:hypothetical protein